MAFNDLRNVMKRKNDRFWKKDQIMEPGFRDNSSGLKDPDVVWSKDSIWHANGSDGRQVKGM